MKKLERYKALRLSDHRLKSAILAKVTKRLQAVAYSTNKKGKAGNNLALPSGITVCGMLPFGAFSGGGFFYGFRFFNGNGKFLFAFNQVG